MPKVNPNILRWARETAGLTHEEAAKKLAIKEARGVSPSDRLKALEDGKTVPNRSMLVKMAKQYRRPLLTFYLSDPPQTGDRGEDYRMLPETIDQFGAAIADVVIRRIRTRQSLVRNVLIEEEEAEPLPYINSLTIKNGVKTVVQSIRKHLLFDLNEYRNQKGAEAAFSYLRGQTEEAGIFVLLINNLGSHHTTISVDAFRGFALADNIAPFIAINSNDSKGAWCFTLVHELAHLWLGATGVSGEMAEKSIEKFCSDVASEFLVPKEELKELQVDQKTDFAEAKERISIFGRKRYVSSTMIAYKLYRSNYFDYAYFKELQDAYRKDFLANKERERAMRRDQGQIGGPSSSILQQYRAGKALVRLVERMMYSGALCTTKAGLILGVKAKSVQGVIEAARPGYLVVRR